MMWRGGEVPVVDVLIEVVEKAITITVSSIDKMNIKVEMPLLVDVMGLNDGKLIINHGMIIFIIIAVKTTSEGICTEQGWGWLIQHRLLAEIITMTDLAGEVEEENMGKWNGIKDFMIK